jgi:hypothetical protein
MQARLKGGQKTLSVFVALLDQFLKKNCATGAFALGKIMRKNLNAEYVDPKPSPRDGKSYAMN